MMALDELPRIIADGRSGRNRNCRWENPQGVRRGTGPRRGCGSACPEPAEGVSPTIPWGVGGKPYPKSSITIRATRRPILTL